ncbi:MAG TPA: UbiD family decarboxylase [Chloroflexota bacterium]|nr:UbiD family decarboxylase [Chloroflexota bacterium]
MSFDDLRGFIAAAEALGELQRLDGAHWDLEIGALTEIQAERRGPALLFDRIADYPPGYRVLANGFATARRTALALNLPLDLGPVELANCWRTRLKEFHKVPPVEVSAAPVLQNVRRGRDVDLGQFPTPRWHEKDGGRYLATGCAVVVRDPDEGWVNLGTYRGQVQGPDRLSLLIVQGKHARIMLNKYHARGEPCPVAVSLGHDPALFAAATLPVPWGVSEYDFVGWLKGAPVPITRGPYTDLPIPATAEIVLEGEIPPLTEESCDEGPFGEWPGYYAGIHKREQAVVPVLRVHTVLHRDAPIILGSPPLKPPRPYAFAFPRTVPLVWDELERAGCTGITGVWQLATYFGLFLVVRIQQQYAGHAKQVGLAATCVRSAAYAGKWVVVVDDDIDIANPGEVFWAMGTRCNVDNVDVVRGVWTSPADPALPDEVRATGNPVSSRIIVDACRPYGKPFPAANVFDTAYKQQIAAKWGIPYGRA